MKKLFFLLLLVCNCPVYAQDSRNINVLKGEYTGQKPPGIIPEVFAPGIVSDTSWAEHGQIAISPKGDEIYWSAFSTKYGNINSQQIYFTKLENGIWTKPALAEFVEDNLKSENGCPVFSPDGNKLFFNSNRPGGLGSMDIWYVERTDSKWGDPVNAGAPYNSPETDWPPVFTKNGYAYRMGFYNDDRNEKPLRFKYKDGRFSDPEPVTFHPDFFPWFSIFVAPDEDYVIFAAYKEIGYGWLDLYICFKTSGGKWAYPVNMGNKVNTELTERFPVVSPDGKYLFFMRHTETQDFFWVSTAFFDDLKKESIEKADTPVEFKEIILKSEDLDKYLGEYSCPDFSSPYTISKEGNILYLKNGSYSIPLVCSGLDKFRYWPGPTKFEFLPDEKILEIINGNVVHVARKQ